MKLPLWKLVLLLFAFASSLGIAVALGTASRSPRGDPRPLALAPDLLDFGRVAIGASETRPFIATNFGSRPLVLSRLEVGAPFELPWGSRTFEAPLPLEPGESRAISVAVRPAERGRVDGVLRVLSEEGELRVALRAVGYRPPEIDVAPRSLSFGEVGLGSTASALVAVRNLGDEALRLEMQGELPFRAGTPEASVAPGAQLDLPVAFAPQRVGRHEAWLSIQSNDPAQTQLRIHLRGAGSPLAPAPQIETGAPALDFGSAAACETRESSLRITNRGADALSIASVTAPAPFSVRGGSRRLEPGASLELALAFSPTDVGGAQARLLIHSNDPRSGVVAVDLRGEGAARCASGPSRPAPVSVADRRGARPGMGSGGAAPPLPVGESAGGEERAQAQPDRDTEPADTPLPPSVRDGSRVALGSNWSQVTPAHVEAVRVDPASGVFTLAGVELPTVEFPFGEFFEFARTGALGRVTELGEAEVVLPLEIVDRHGELTRLDLALTTGTAETRSRGTLFTRAGEPLGARGEATLVGLATFPSGRLQDFTLEVVLNVQVAR